jgi:hypothetical protein
MTDSAGSPLPESIAGNPPQRYIAEPSAVYLTGEQFLQISSLANVGGVTLQVNGRVLRPDNTISWIQFTHTPNSNRTIATTRVALSEGWLLGLRVAATAGTPAFGQVWVNLELVLGNTGATIADQTLGYGFCTTNTPFAWPLSVNTLPLDGPGNLRSIAGTTPGAGGEITETVPTGARWELIAFNALLATSAAVANRFPRFALDDGVRTLWVTPTGAAQTASQTNNYFLGQGLIASFADGQGNVYSPLPLSVKLGAGFRIRSNTVALQVADQYSNVQYLVREWMSGE